MLAPFTEWGEQGKEASHTWVGNFLTAWQFLLLFFFFPTVWSWNSPSQKSLTEQRSVWKSDRNSQVTWYRGHSTHHFRKRQNRGFKDKGINFFQGMEALVDGRTGWEESVNDLGFGKQKGYVRICPLGMASCRTPVPIMSRHNLNGSTSGPVT